MLELPPELHLRIAECLSQADLFNFRLSCKTLSSPGHSVLFSPQKASRLYIHPTTIHQFIDICHDDTLATKVTTVVVLGDFTHIRFDPVVVLSGSMPDVQFSRANEGFCRLPWPCYESIDSTAAFLSGKVPFPTAYMHVIAATKNLSNLQKIACATRAKLPGLNSTSDIDVTTQVRQFPSKLAENDEWPIAWSNAEFILGLALNVPKITHIDSQCEFHFRLADIKSFDLLTPKAKGTTVMKSQESNGKDRVEEQKFAQLNFQLRSLTYEAFDDSFMPFGRRLLGHVLLQRCSSIRNLELIISDTSIDSGDIAFCIQACRGLNNLCNFKVRPLRADQRPLIIDVDDDDLSIHTKALQCASVFNAFLLQHAKTLETCVIDSIVSTSEDQLNIFAGEFKEFSATGKNAQICFRTYTCKPPAIQQGDTGDLRGLRVVMETVKLSNDRDTGFDEAIRFQKGFRKHEVSCRQGREKSE